jgi:hypothetical protein
MQCPKCNGEMHKKATVVSGNTKYDKWQCMKCWTDKTVALGVIGGK